MPSDPSEGEPADAGGDPFPLDDPGALAAPGAHPLDPSASAGVEWVQTHLSHVFLTRERVTKFRKPVDFGFVHFSTRSQRNADCLREVALNRRLSPSVYLGVAPLELAAGGPRIGATREAISDPGLEHCVVMRRLPAGGDALTRLERGQLSGEDVDRVAHRLAAFHREHDLGTPAPFSPEEWLARCVGPARANLDSLGSGSSTKALRDRVEALRERTESFARDAADRFEARRLAGRAVDAHGDLHLQHVWWEGDEIQIIDCLEFDDVLRRIDRASEVAFFAMDLAYRGARSLAERFLRTYAAETGDFDLYAVVDFFASYRAAVRAKVAAIAADDEGMDPDQRSRSVESARRHLELALELSAPVSPGALVLVGGAIGTGKSTAAAHLADVRGAVWIRADRVRKQSEGVAPGGPAGSAAAGWSEGLYTPENKARVYASMLESARTVLASGRQVVLDATWSQRSDRERALALARSLSTRATLYLTTCDEDVVRERLARRQAEGTDPSDAGPELLRASLDSFEAPTEWPSDALHRVATDREGWRAGLEEWVAGS